MIYLLDSDPLTTTTWTKKFRSYPVFPEVHFTRQDFSFGAWRSLVFAGYAWPRHGFKMARIGRVWRLSAVSLAAAGGAFKISREISSKTKETTPESNLELVLVQMAFRHGARTPVFRPPCEELELVTWTADLLGTLPHTDVAYELKHVSGGPCPVSESKQRLLKRLLKVWIALIFLILNRRQVRS